MKKYTYENVIKAISIAFPNEKTEQILKLLEIYGKEQYEYEKERVHLAILKLSNGDIKKLHDYLNLAKIDYRDVLMAAEYYLDGSEIVEPYRIIGIEE